MPVRAFRPDDAPVLARLSADCLHGEAEFVLNPLWKTEDELFAEFARHGIEPSEHMLVAQAEDGTVVGLSGASSGLTVRVNMSSAGSSQGSSSALPS